MWCILEIVWNRLSAARIRPMDFQFYWSSLESKSFGRGHSFVLAGSSLSNSSHNFKFESIPSSRAHCSSPATGSYGSRSGSGTDSLVSCNSNRETRALVTCWEDSPRVRVLGGLGALKKHKEWEETSQFFVWVCCPTFIIISKPGYGKFFN